ncbi:MAG TPA: sodium/solute symporter [Phycisphaerae bacterium]|nr:sodium/solute symporter [Phycisphaerae bacterium]
MKLATADLLIFAAYFVGIIALGIHASRKVGATRRDYFLAGDKLSWWMVGGSIVAANISSHHFIGVMGTAYARGFVAMCIEWGAILIGFNALLWIFLPFYLRNGFYTMPEFLQKRFGAGARLMYALVILVIYIFIEISAVLYMGAIAVDTLFGAQINCFLGAEKVTLLGASFAPSMLLCIVALAVFTGFYTVLGGLRAVVWTEMVQLAVLIGGGLVLSFATLHATGGWSGFMATSGEWKLLLPATDPDFPWTQYLGAFLCISVFYCATNQFIVQRTLAAKDEWHARMGVVFTDYLKFLLPLIIVVPGLMAPTLYPGIQPDSTFPTLVKGLLPQIMPGLVGLVMAGLIAAVMSHLSGAVNACTTILTMDLYLPYIHKQATEAQAVRFGKIMAAVIMLTGVFWAAVLLEHSDKPIFVYLLHAYGYVTPGIATMFLLGILWKRATHAGVLTASIVAIPLVVAMDFLPSAVEKLGFSWAPTVVPYLKPAFNQIGIVFWLCMGIGVVVSLFTRPKTCAELEGMIWTPSSLRLPAEMRAKMSFLKSPALWWAIITAVVVYMYVKYA